MHWNRALCPRRPPRLRTACVLAFTLAFALFGCSLSFDTGPLPSGDGGPPQNDAGTPDSGNTGSDSGGSTPDGSVPPDAGTPTKPQPPQFIDKSTDSRSNANEFVVSKPSLARQGDLLLVSIYVTDQNNIITLPAGWTVIDNHVLTSCQALTVWAYHFYSDPEPSTYTFGIKDARFVESLAITAYRGVDSSNPIAQHTVTEFNDTLTYGPVSLTTNQANETVVMVAINQYATGHWTGPSEMPPSRADTNVVGVFDEPRVNAGATGPRTATSTDTGSQSCGDVAMLGLRAAP